MRTKRICVIGIMTALIAVCSWVTVPGPVPFTLQTFAVFLTVMLLGCKDGFIAILIYILLGTVGLPVFSGFRGGIGVLMGATGGYIAGFLLTPLIMLPFEIISRGTHVPQEHQITPHGTHVPRGPRITPRKTRVALGARKRCALQILSALAALAVCYTFGTLWYSVIYISSGKSFSILGVLTACVFPFILPDVLKITLAFIISDRINKPKR